MIGAGMAHKPSLASFTDGQSLLDIAGARLAGPVPLHGFAIEQDSNAQEVFMHDSCKWPVLAQPAHPDQA